MFPRATGPPPQSSLCRRRAGRGPAQADTPQNAGDRWEQGWGCRGQVRPRRAPGRRTHCSFSRRHWGSRSPSQSSRRPASPSGLSLRCSSRRVGRERSTPGKTSQPASVRQQFWRLETPAVRGPKSHPAPHKDKSPLAVGDSGPRNDGRACPALAGPDLAPYLSFWILQVGLCRPWSTRSTPPSPSSLVRRLSSVRDGLAWSAEPMSLQRTSVRPQSSSLWADTQSLHTVDCDRPVTGQQAGRPRGSKRRKQVASVRHFFSLLSSRRKQATSVRFFSPSLHKFF